MKNLFPFLFAILLVPLTTCDLISNEDDPCDKTAYNSTKTYTVAVQATCIYDYDHNIIASNKGIKVEFNKMACGGGPVKGIITYEGFTDDQGEFQSGTASYQIRNENDMITTTIYTTGGLGVWTQVFTDSQIFRENEFRKSEMLTYREINCFVPLH